MAISQRFLLLLICFTVTLHHTFAFRPLTEEVLDIYQQQPQPTKLNSTVYDLLLQFGFPKGLLPDVVKSYSLSDNGDFEIELERQCYVHFDRLVFYDKKITGKLTYGQISDITGIQAKKLFLWVSVTRIQAQPGSDYIDFYVGFLSEQLPKDEFQRIPACKSKACVMAKDSYLISESTTEEAKSKKVITLKSSDGETFEVDEAVAVESQTIKHMIEDECADNGIPLPNVTSKILAKVIEYCKKHVAVPEGSGDERTNDEDLKNWDADFVKVDQATLFDLILAANYLDIKSLLDLTCQTVADMMKGKTPEEIRKIFNIKNDFTPEEEEEVRKENHWPFE